MSIHVLLVDDHKIVRQGLKQILADTDDIEVAGEAENGLEALQKLQELAVDVVVLDVAMPKMDGLSTIGVLHQEKYSQHVIVLSMYPEEQYAIRFFKAGAAGYLTKESAPEELIAAIRKVAQGGRYVSAFLAERLASALSDHTIIALHESLSDREYQVMQLIAAGCRTHEIAEQLSLSVKTVSTYRSRMLEKLHLRSNAEVMRYAIDHHLA
jgi:DNA-binding NarL/FixJ family response regulator